MLNQVSNASSLPVFVGLDYGEMAVRVFVMDATGHMLGNRDLANDAGRLDAYVRGVGGVGGVWPPSRGSRFVRGVRMR